MMAQLEHAEDNTARYRHTPAALSSKPMLLCRRIDPRQLAECTGVWVIGPQQQLSRQLRGCCWPCTATTTSMQMLTAPGAHPRGFCCPCGRAPSICWPLAKAVSCALGLQLRLQPVTAGHKTVCQAWQSEWIGGSRTCFCYEQQVGLLLVAESRDLWRSSDSSGLSANWPVDT